MADTPKHSVSVAGVVVDDQDRVLVIQRRDNGHWEPPGGVLELDESPEDGVMREVFEETGIHVQPRILSGIYKNMTKGVLALVFRCDYSQGDLVLSDETRSVAWKKRDEIVHDMSEAYAVRVIDAFADGVQIRDHDGTNLIDRSSRASIGL